MILVDRSAEREELARHITEHTGITDPGVLAAFRKVPRERFVRPEDAERAYEDRALPIGNDQTISQPSMIALMLDALRPKPTDRALEVGAGSGYAAALLARLVDSVNALEIRPDLAEGARRTLASVGVTNVRIHPTSGVGGLPAEAPFDVILVSAAALTVPPSLVAQLASGGRIAIPVGAEGAQTLHVGVRSPSGQMAWEERTRCVFVPLVTDAQAEPTVLDANAIGVVPARS